MTLCVIVIRSLTVLEVLEFAFSIQNMREKGVKRIKDQQEQWKPFLPTPKG